jgi:hypothetical protein
MADERKDQRPTLIQVIGSVLASFFGVQGSRARERDFKHGRAGVFIAVGFAMVALFVIAVLIVVKLVLKHAAQ